MDTYLGIALGVAILAAIGTLIAFINACFEGWDRPKYYRHVFIGLLAVLCAPVWPVEVLATLAFLARQGWPSEDRRWAR